MTALRLATFRSLEMIAKSHKKHAKKPSELTKSNLLLSQRLLSEIVDATRRCTSNLQFASLFLEVGRQTEPSNLDHLFPLPLPDKEAEIKHDPGISTARSVIDLFTICIDEGSLAASASALPLLTSRYQARYYCGVLLDEAIDNFVRNTDPSRSYFDSTEEERRALGDFFRFGMKMEDAELCDDKFDTEKSQGDITSIGSTASLETMDQSISYLSLIAQKPKNAQRSLICGLGASSSILNYMAPSSVQGESERRRMEYAIRREASSFIKKGLDEPSLDFAMLPDWDENPFDTPNTNRVDIDNVARLVGDALLDLLQAEHSNNWKAIAAFAKMIFEEGVDLPSSYKLPVEVANKAQPLDILSIIPESYEVNNGIEENMSAYLEEGIVSCHKQITTADANIIVDMALLLLDRVHLLPSADVGDQAVVELGMVYIVMVAGGVGEHTQPLQEILEQDCLLSKCYLRSTNNNTID
eukprot:CAMPEP_0201129874 /NCGR_PEP_ID=MMETSP0850-20130426/38171_1 /ASSEMBLY_ACC=CAM_ASM_000622 /TAXON_ID=183588 /ORGANISM="Pseudo-nitzschia fraudulenta, Strain WWA7" /LENGTH=469 /DNA_ID=CAMNT_0047399469 /DNA_START=1 /DNA_END=1410 /DNA_ORIENTATION=+